MGTLKMRMEDISNRKRKAEGAATKKEHPLVRKGLGLTAKIVGLPKGNPAKANKKRRSIYAREYGVEKEEVCRHCRYEGCLLASMKAGLKKQGDRMNQKRPNGKPMFYLTKREIKECIESLTSRTIENNYPNAPIRRDGTKNKRKVPCCIQSWIDKNY